jgi:exosortase
MSSVEQAQLLAGEHASPALPASLTRVWEPWRFIGAVLMVALCVFITRHAWARMLAISIEDEESSHVLLVPVAALWIIFNRRHQLAGCRPAGTFIGPLLIVTGWASLIYGYDIRDNEFWFFGTIVMAVGSLLSFVGSQVMVRLGPAFVVLGFLIPMPVLFRELISLPLQNIMARLAEHVGDVLGFLISRNGNQLVVNGQTIEIAEACNGIRMVFALFLVAYTVAFAAPLKAWARVLLLLGAPPLALLCNLIRIVPSIWLYGHSSKELAEQFHDLAGWGMVVVAYFLLMGLLELLDWAGVPVMQRGGAT